MDRQLLGGVPSLTPARVAGLAALVLVAAGALAVAPPTDDPGTSGPPVTVRDVSGEGTVTVTYATANGTRQFTVSGVAPGAAEASADWAYLPRSSLPPRLAAVDGDPAAGVVTVGRWALVGNLTAASARIDGVRVTVVAPAGMAVDPARKVGFLDAYLSPYALGPADRDEVLLLVAPDALPSDGRLYDQRGYVTQQAFWDGDVASVWIHEYVHARQDFRLARGMRWFREASATYLSYRVMEAQYGGVTEADVRARLDASARYPETALANPSAWTDSRADYHRGARLLYAVDAAVRQGSDGDHTLADVFRAMNRRDDAISVGEFVAIVERLAGKRQPWLRAAITEGGALDQRVERASDVFTE